MRSVAFRKAFAGILLANTSQFCSRTRRMWRYSAQPSIGLPSTFRQRFSSLATEWMMNMLHSFASSRIMRNQHKSFSRLAGLQVAYNMSRFCVERCSIFFLLKRLYSFCEPEKELLCAFLNYLSTFTCLELKWINECFEVFTTKNDVAIWLTFNTVFINVWSNQTLF